MRKELVVSVYLLAAYFMLAGSSFAASTQPAGPKEKQICEVISDRINVGKEADKIVKTSIQMGYKPCLVIGCSLDAGAKLEDVITGAMAAGVPSDVVSKCAVSAGADAGAVGAALSAASPQMCFVIPEKPESIRPPAAIVVSPYDF
jgi:hypothetical protein